MSGRTSSTTRLKQASCHAAVRTHHALLLRHNFSSDTSLGQCGVVIRHLIHDGRDDDCTVGRRLQMHTTTSWPN